jgi:hypothetical protein
MQICECGQRVVVRIHGRYRKPRDKDHDLCMRCYAAEVDRTKASNAKRWYDVFDGERDSA